MAEHMEIDIKDIVVLDNENRAEEKGGDIISSIGKVGIKVPLIVYKEDEHYCLVAGHRRLKSARHFKIDRVPVQIIDKRDCNEVRAIENMDRKPLHPLDESEQIRRLQQVGWSNSEISKVLSIPVARVRKRALLNNLSNDGKNKLRKGQISLEVAEEIAMHDPDTQKDLMKKVYQSTSAEDVRRMYLASQGFSLDGMVDEMINAEPCCINCPNNAAEDPELFPGTNGSCKDTNCLCEKIRNRMKSLGIDTLVTRWDCPEDIKENISKDFNVDLGFYGYRAEPSGDDDIKGMLPSGKVVYQPKRNADNTPREKTQKEIVADKYYEELKTAGELIPPYIKECAEAYMEKNHKNELFPDSSEIVMFADYLLKNLKWDIQRVVGDGKSYEKVLAESNKMKVGYALMCIFAEQIESNEDNAYTFFRPNYPGEKDDVTLPVQFKLTDALCLKTSKVKKKAEAALKRLQDLQREYRELK